MTENISEQNSKESSGGTPQDDTSATGAGSESPEEGAAAMSAAEDAVTD